MKPCFLNAPWSAFENKKPSFCLQAASALCLVNSFQAWIWIFNINFHSQPWSQLSCHTFDLCFLILPEVGGKRVIEIRIFFLCCFWWLGFLFCHCARCIHVFCLVFHFVHYCIAVTVGSLCPWTLQINSECASPPWKQPACRTKIVHRAGEVWCKNPSCMN